MFLLNIASELVLHQLYTVYVIYGNMSTGL